MLLRQSHTRCQTTAARDRGAAPAAAPIPLPDKGPDRQCRGAAGPRAVTLLLLPLLCPSHILPLLSVSITPSQGHIPPVPPESLWSCFGAALASCRIIMSLWNQSCITPGAKWTLRCLWGCDVGTTVLLSVWKGRLSTPRGCPCARDTSALTELGVAKAFPKSAPAAAEKCRV